MLNINFKIIALGIMLLAGDMQAIAQRYETVVHDPERNWFNEGNPLPAEKPLIPHGRDPTDRSTGTTGTTPNCTGGGLPPAGIGTDLDS